MFQYYPPFLLLIFPPIIFTFSLVSLKTLAPLLLPPPSLLSVVQPSSLSTPSYTSPPLSKLKTQTSLLLRRSMSSSSTTGGTNPDGYKFECECGMKAPLRTALTEQNVGRRFLGCANYKGPKKCNFFDWFDPETCERGKAFGNWLVKKNQNLQMVIQNLQLQCKEQRNEMEHDFGLKMEEWNKKGEWYVLKINLMNQKLKEMEDRSNGLKLKMEEMEANNAGFKFKKEEMEAKNDHLVKRNKAMKKEIEYGNLKVKLLIAMVVALVGIGIVCFGDQGVWKKKMLALP